MKEYIVKVTYTANEKNRGYAGQTDVYYRGKNDDFALSLESFECRLMEGWKRRHFAERYIKNDDPDYFWDKAYEIIEIEVPEKGAGL